jgi:hypothetical protein
MTNQPIKDKFCNFKSSVFEIFSNYIFYTSTVYIGALYSFLFTKSNICITVLIIPFVGYFFITLVYLKFNFLISRNKIVIGNINDEQRKIIDNFYTFKIRWKNENKLKEIWRKSNSYLIMTGCALLLFVPIYLLLEKPNSHVNINTSNTIAYTENDTIIVKMFSNLSEMKELKVLYSDSVLTTTSFSRMTLLDYPVIAGHPFYTCKIPNKTVSGGLKHFYLVDVNNNIIGSSNALQIKHSALLSPKFAEIRKKRKDLFIKYENPSYRECYRVLLNCNNLNHDFKITFNRPFLETDSITIPIQQNDIYQLELIIIDSLNNQIIVDSIFIY